MILKDRKIIVSFIIPVYNAEKFIHSAVLSIVEHMAFPVEIIIVNDGSRDLSDTICQSLSNSFKVIKYFKTENLGAGHARNYGIMQAEGRWVLFLDSDDLILSEFFLPEMLELLCNAEKAGIDILYFPKVLADYSLSTPPSIVMPERNDEIIGQHYIPNLEFWSSIYKTNYLREKNIKFFEYRKQDVESAFRFRAFSNTDSILVVNTLVFYVHRDNPTSNVNTWKLNTLYNIKTRVFCELYKEYHRDDESTKAWLYLQFLYYVKCFLINSIQYGVDSGDTSEMIDLLHLVRNTVYDGNLPMRYKMFLKMMCKLATSTMQQRLLIHMVLKKKKNVNDSYIQTSEIPVDDFDILRGRLMNYGKKVYEELIDE